MMLKVVIFGYLNNIYSCRKIENALTDRVSFMWLSGGRTPDHNTINRFRSSRLKDSIRDIFTQAVRLLVEMGHLSLETVYPDGTKIESRANRYTFVWRKSVEKHKAKLEEKIRRVLEQVEEGIAIDNHPDDEPPTPVNSAELKKRVAELNRENRTKAEEKAIKELENKHLPKLEGYEKHLETLGNRNSYSKTDPAATFMRLKDDHLQNGQLKPAHNVQIGTENQIITHYDIFPNPGDTLTLPPFMEGFKARYGKYPSKTVADAGYGSEENYEFMEENNMEAFVKYNSFHKEQAEAFKNNGFAARNLYYNKEKDYLVCPMGQQMKKVGERARVSESGHVSRHSVYEAGRCTGCPPRCPCHTAEGNRRVEINHRLNRYREKARERLTSEEGRMHGRRRAVEPEAVFGQAKSNKGYNRFRHFNDTEPDKVMMDFAIFAVAFNLQKLNRKRKNTGQNQPGVQNRMFFLCLFIVFCPGCREYRKLNTPNWENKKCAA
jgi:hypothetical protein